jgi:hypothetical protein
MDPAAVVPPRRRRSRAWIVYFLILAILASIAIVVPILFNINQQLRPEQLEAARQRWRDHEPRDYDLTFAITWDRDQTPERHMVAVRGGKIVFASCEGEILFLAPAMRAAAGLPGGGLPRAHAYDVPAIFDHLDGLLREEGARRNFLIAGFDPNDGYPRRFIRRIRGTSTREKWDVRVWPAGTLERGEAR